MYENLCQPCILKPTRIVENQRPSLIDNIFINSIESPVSGNLIERIRTQSKKKWSKLDICIIAVVWSMVVV